jgi:hypothetical protein
MPGGLQSPAHAGFLDIMPRTIAVLLARPACDHIKIRLGAPRRFGVLR